MTYTIVGIPNRSDFLLTEEIRTLLPSHTVFSGGKRHYDLIKHQLPQHHTWIEISGRMEALITRYHLYPGPIMVFASGDPLFYGFAGTLQTLDPQATLQVYPSFHSLQLLCHRQVIPYQTLQAVSVHGRSWKELDTALIRQHALIGVLTDAVKTPAHIAQRLLEYGFDQYTMIVGESLESNEETIRTLSLQEASTLSYHPLNCILLKQTSPKPKAFGIPDEQFFGLENRPNMITKMPVRLASLAQLDLYPRQTLWDIGFCTGSVSIEAKTQFPSLNIIAFEKREECESLFEKNARKHSTPGISMLITDFFEYDLSNVPRPDAIFIGGHGNRLEELIRITDTFLLPKGRLVINAVKEDSKTQFTNVITSLNYKLLPSPTITVDGHNPITILTAEKPLHE